MALILLMLQAHWYPTPTGLPKAGRTTASELPLSVYVLIQFPDRHSPVEYPCYPKCLQLCSTKQTTHRYPVLNLKEKHLLSANRLEREEEQQQEGVPQTRFRCTTGDSRHRVSVVPMPEERIACWILRDAIITLFSPTQFNHWPKAPQ